MPINRECCRIGVKKRALVALKTIVSGIKPCVAWGRLETAYFTGATRVQGLRLFQKVKAGYYGYLGIATDKYRKL